MRRVIWILTCAAFGVVSQFVAAEAAGSLALPDSRVTPGAVGDESGTLPGTAAVCLRGYSRSMRHRYDTEWRRYRVAMFREYGIPHSEWSRYTVDHLVPIELGGRPFGVANGAWDLRNVWPEPKAEAEQKDVVENALHAAVCSSGGYRGVHLSLQQADAAIARDWRQTPVGLPRP